MQRSWFLPEEPVFSLKHQAVAVLQSKSSPKADWTWRELWLQGLFLSFCKENKGFQHKYLRPARSLELAQQESAKIKDVTASQVVFAWALVKTTVFFCFTDITLTVLTMTVLNGVVDMTVSGTLSTQHTLKTYRTLPFRTVELSSTDSAACYGESFHQSILFLLLNSFNILSCTWRCERRGIPWTRLPGCHKANTHLNHFCHVFVFIHVFFMVWTLEVSESHSFCIWCSKREFGPPPAACEGFKD